jgi:hypothetical protein
MSKRRISKIEFDSFSLLIARHCGERYYLNFMSIVYSHREEKRKEKK